MKIFLDIGAHIGETLQVIQHPRWKFDRIVCFEPAESCWPYLDAIADNRVEICKFGLWHRDEILTLNNPGAIGASMSSDKDALVSTVLCEFRDAATWFAANVHKGDEVYVKINAEGAEADVVDRLHAAGELSKISHLLIHFDIRKIPSLQDREDALVRQLELSGIEYHAAEEIQFGGVYRGTRNWLLWCNAPARTRDLRFKVINRYVFGLRRRLYPAKVWVAARRSSRSAS